MSNNLQPTTGSLWSELEEHQASLRDVTIKSHFKSDLARASNFKLSHNDISFDFSKNNMNERTIELLLKLARDCALEDKRDRLYNGATINTTEGRAALHMALRGTCPDHLDIDGKNVKDSVDQTLEQIKAFAEKFDREQRFDHIVHIGIGGSDLGPKLVCSALRHLSKPGVDIRFLSNIDPDHFHDTLDGLNADKTLFIVVSKSFSTQETMTNAHSARDWLVSHLTDPEYVNSHFCAVTSKFDDALSFGIPDDNIFDLPDWVGGRFSLWSAVGLPIALYLGYDHFKALLSGAHDIDQHFLNTPLESNIPVLMGLISIWHRNLWNYNIHCVLPYSERLKLMAQYVQQLDMESNGKSVDAQGAPLIQPSAPAIFGASGTGAQHTFFQMLHQGSDIIPCEFIAVKTPVHRVGDHHEKLISNVLGQTKALMDGYKNTEQPHKNFEGNRPSNTVWLRELTPFSLGMLLSLYEHRAFVQGAIWNINSFDQYGVELGKNLALKALERLQNLK
ncbi:MAG: glucose-6-phosphate isomerase [Micavibrio sp.]|nr:glucose-6-phosphate isomerase [Micavibrio sp.]|tara:strand:+ start:1856 stop:3370 length:1515 start_codon:yes stop_codon:yes gene_type:complete